MLGDQMCNLGISLCLYINLNVLNSVKLEKNICLDKPALLHIQFNKSYTNLNLFSKDAFNWSKIKDIYNFK